MAQIIITIPDAQIQRILDGICGQYKYDTASGITKAQFARQKVGEMIKNIVLAYETETAKAIAEEQARTSIQSISIT